MIGVQIVSTNKDILTNQYYYWLIVSRSMKLKRIWLTYYIHQQVEDLKEIFKWSRHGEFTIQLITKISDCNINRYIKLTMMSQPIMVTLLHHPTVVFIFHLGV